MEEIWKSIKEWEGMYDISSKGRVRSIKRTDARGHLVSGRIMRLVKTRGDYLTVKLSDAKTNRTKRYIVSRLVAEAFIPNPLNLPQVNHKDENRQNNNIKNLEWCDSAYNLNYNGGRQKRAKKICKEVCQLDSKGNVLHVFPSAIEAARVVNGFASNISCVCHGKMNTYKGYGWKYKQTIRL